MIMFFSTIDALYTICKSWLYLDACELIECPELETCQKGEGVCKCGNADTCKGNVDFPLCDPMNSQCIASGKNLV